MALEVDFADLADLDHVHLLFGCTFTSPLARALSNTTAAAATYEHLTSVIHQPRAPVAEKQCSGSRKTSQPATTTTTTPHDENVVLHDAYSSAHCIRPKLQCGCTRQVTHVHGAYSRVTPVAGIP